ncbi:hypothetical protein V8C42DRAFT_318566 [Trichoderma barbatum]
MPHTSHLTPRGMVACVGFTIHLNITKCVPLNTQVLALGWATTDRFVLGLAHLLLCTCIVCRLALIRTSAEEDKNFSAFLESLLLQTTDRNANQVHTHLR